MAIQKCQNFTTMSPTNGSQLRNKKITIPSPELGVTKSRQINLPTQAHPLK